MRLSRLFLVILLAALTACGAQPTAAPTPPPATEAPTRTPRPAPTAIPPTATRVATPTTEPTATPEIDLLTLTNELSATIVAGLPPTPIPPPGEQSYMGIVGANVIPLQGQGEGVGLFAAYTVGMRNYEPQQNHLVAIYQREDDTWKELARYELEFADYVDPSGVTEVQIAPGRYWIEVQSGVGAHGGCYDLLAFDGKALKSAVSHCHESPGAGEIKDLNGDGTAEVMLNQTANYVFCYACGVKIWSFQVLRWDGAKFVPVELEPVRESAPEDIRLLTNQAIELARGGLWKDAQSVIDMVPPSSEPIPEATWAAVIIRMHADARAEQARSGPYPLLDNLFYGDYVAVLETMRPYTPEQLFDKAGPLIAGTPAEGFEDSLTSAVTQTTTMAINAQPELAVAYFLRGWATYLSNPDDPAALKDLEEAAIRAPDEELFSAALKYVRK